MIFDYAILLDYYCISFYYFCIDYSTKQNIFVFHRVIYSNMTALPEKTYFELHAEELLKQAGLNKARFAEQMGVARQNIQKTFETKNVFTLMRAAEILNVPLTVLIYGKKAKSSIDGFVEINGVTYRLKSREDIEDLLSRI